MVTKPVQGEVCRSSQDGYTYHSPFTFSCLPESTLHKHFNRKASPGTASVRKAGESGLHDMGVEVRAPPTEIVSKTYNEETQNSVREE